MASQNACREQARRRLADLEILVIAQRKLIARIKRAGEPTDMVEDILRRMENALEYLRAERNHSHLIASRKSGD